MADVVTLASDHPGRPVGSHLVDAHTVGNYWQHLQLPHFHLQLPHSVCLQPDNGLSVPLKSKDNMLDALLAYLTGNLTSLGLDWGT